MTAPHRYVSGHGGTCQTCGKGQFHAEHFNGDGVAAAEAYRQAKARQEANRKFIEGLATGVRVRAREDHPRDDIAARFGTVASVERETQTATVVWTATDDWPELTVAIPIKYLDPPPMPTPPRFASIEEAEAWMEQHAPEMGVELPKLPPRFASVEEADEWMRRQAGEPYIPPSWQEQRDAETQRALDAYDELYSGGTYRRPIRGGWSGSSAIYDEVHDFIQEDSVMRIVRGAIARADGTKPWEEKP